jgi:hypothetical protein
MNGGDNRFGAVFNRKQERIEIQSRARTPRDLAEFANVDAGYKGPARADQHNSPHGSICNGIPQSLFDRFGHS